MSVSFLGETKDKDLNHGLRSVLQRTALERDKSRAAAWTLSYPKTPEVHVVRTDICQRSERR